MTLGSLNPGPSVIHHTFYGDSGSGTDTSVVFGQNGSLTGTTNIVNPGLPRPSKLRGWWLNSATLGVLVDGDWTLRLRKNRATSDSATGTWNPSDLNTVAYGNWDKQIILEPTEQYHLLADGPARAIMLVRLVVEWEIL